MKGSANVSLTRETIRKDATILVEEQLRHNPWLTNYVSKEKLIRIAEYSIFSVNTISSAMSHGLFYFGKEEWIKVYSYSSGHIWGYAQLSREGVQWKYTANMYWQFCVTISKVDIFSLYLSEYLVAIACDKQTPFEKDPNNIWDQLDIEREFYFGWHSDIPSCRFRDFVEETFDKLNQKGYTESVNYHPKYPSYY